jgi:hypothetical protein
LNGLRKHLASRIFGLAALYCAVFIALVILQFSGKGTFTITANTMIIKGRYLQPFENEKFYVENDEQAVQLLAGGVRIFFGGLEFILKEERGGGLVLTGGDGSVIPVNPESFSITENTARLGLPGGSTLVFSSLGPEKEPELQINAQLAADVSEISIPIIPHRSLVRNNGQIGIMYNGNRYMINGAGQEFENNRIILSKGNSSVSYRSKGRQRAFDPSNFIIPQAQNYYFALSNWQDLSYTRWYQNASSLRNEDDITGYLSEALRQNNYNAALSSIPRDFNSSTQHTYRSAVYTGGMTSAYRTFVSEENKRLNAINTLMKENSPDVLKEEHIIDYLLIRGNTVLAYDIIKLIKDLNPEKLTIDYCPGLLEAYSDIKRWNTSIDNPVEPLIEQILILVSENLSKDTVSNLVYASGSKERDLYYSVRLGNTLINWAEDAKNTDWADIGRSLVLSALTNAGPGAGNLYANLKLTENYPRALWLGEPGFWAWTVSPSVKPSWKDSNLNISFSFPVGSTHHVIISGIKPFLSLQIHDTNWRTDSQYERYDSSGWVYHQQEQILVLKLRHREPIESIKIIYKYAAPPPVVEEAKEDANTGDDID